MSELRAYQKEIGEWGDETFNSKRSDDLAVNLYAIANHLKKEAQEVVDSAGCDDYELISEEISDCFLLLLHIAHNLEIDLLDCAREKMEINYKRTWGEPDKDGVIEHV